MKDKLKSLIRKTACSLNLDLTKNLEYDRLTKKVIRSYVNDDSNCIDIGCHKGEILDLFLKYAPLGKHFAFEPIPAMYENLENSYGRNCTIFPYALGDETGTTTFNYVKNAPAYSGLKQRKYDVKQPDIEKIDVEIRKLDDIIPKGTKINLIKIDVEGAEFSVLKGARRVIKDHKPLVIFEFGLGASDYYNTDPATLFDFFKNTPGMQIYLFKDWIKNRDALTKETFISIYNSNREYYFVAN